MKGNVRETESEWSLVRIRSALPNGHSDGERAEPLFCVVRVSPNRVAFIEDNVKFFRIPELSELIVLVGVRPRFVAVFEAALVGLAKHGEDFALRRHIGGNGLNRLGGKIAADCHAAREYDYEKQ